MKNLQYFVYLFVISVCFLQSYCSGRISDKRLCADSKCSVAVSLARAVLRYQSDDERILSFAPGETVTIYSKSAGSRADLWGAQIGKKRGYVPKNLIQEYRILKKELKYTVTTDEDAVHQASVEQTSAEQASAEQTSAEQTSAEQAQLNNELKPADTGKEPYYDVVDGTTLYIPEDSTMQMTTNSDAKASTPSRNSEPTSGSREDTSAGDPQVHSQVLTKNNHAVDAAQSESTADDNEQRGGLISPSSTPAEISGSDVPPADSPSISPEDSPSISPEDSPSISPQDTPSISPEDSPSISPEVSPSISPEDTPSISPEDSPSISPEDSPSISPEVSPSISPADSPAEIPVSDVPPTEIPVMSIPSQVLTENKQSSVGTPAAESEVPNSEANSADGEANSVYEYFADTLTGWMSGDGGSAEDEEENDDTEQVSSGQQPEEAASPQVPQTNISAEESQKSEVPEVISQQAEFPETNIPVEQQETETAGSNSDDAEHSASVGHGQQDSSVTEAHGQQDSLTPPEESQQPELPQINQQDSLTNIDISKINYLSTNPNIVAQSDQPPVDEEQSKASDEQGKIPIPDSDFQDKIPELVVTETVPPVASYYSSSETQNSETSKSEEKIEHSSSEDFTPSSVEEASAPFTYSWDLPSDKVPSPEPNQEQPAETTAETSGGLEDTAATETLTQVYPIESSSGIITTASPSDTFQQTTTASPNESTASSGSSEEITTASGSSEEITTASPSVEAAQTTGSSEEITTASPSVKAAATGTFEEITTASPSVDPAQTTGSIEPAEEEGESGAIFASWVYTLFGYGETSLETTTAAPVISTEMPPQEALEQATSESSWWPWGSSDHTKADSQQTCSAESGGDCDEVGALPSLPQEQISAVPSLPQQQIVSSTVSQEQIVSSTPNYQQPWAAETVKMDLGSFLTSGTFIYLVVTAVTVLIFTLGYYYIENTKKDGSHVAIINSLQKQLLVASKEKLILQDDLQMTKDQVSQVQTSSSFSCEEVEQLKEKLEESERVRIEAEDQVVGLEKELEAATEAGLELNKMLSEFLSAQKGSEDLSMGVELLQQQLNKQQTTISTMNQALSAKTLEIESLQHELAETQGQLQELQRDREKTLELLQEVQQHKQKLKEDLEESCVTLANQLLEAAQQRETEVDVLREQLKASELRLSEVQDSLKARSSEVEALENSLSQLKHLADDGETDEGHKKLDALMNVGKAQAELKLVTSERDVLKERLQGEEDARQLLEDHVTVIREQVEKLKERHELAEKEKLEAQTKLEVLSSYFKEKETQLQKELGLQEAMSEQKKEHVSSTHVRIKSLEEEINNFKIQNETLKQEIVDQERSLKSQLTTLEKKAHENWIAARQAERKLDDSKQEAGTLRNRLTLLEKGSVTLAQNGEEGKTAQRTLDSNGEPTSPALHIGDSPSMSPPHLHPQHYMMMPPPPGQFMPPPPPPEYMHSPPPPLPLYPDRRPPPLGRMSSPPPHPFSPPPPDRYSSPYRPRSPASDRSLPRYRYSSRSPSPPPYEYGHYPSAQRPWDEEPRSGFRPLNRDKDNKGSTLSSGHSSESLGKSSRHSKS